MGLREIRELEARCPADLLITAEGTRASAAVDGIESVLKGCHQRPFAGCQRNEELSLRRTTVDAHGTSDTQRYPRKAEQPFNAARKLRRLDLRSRAADLLDAVAGLRQTAPPFQQCLAR